MACNCTLRGSFKMDWDRFLAEQFGCVRSSETLSRAEVFHRLLGIARDAIQYGFVNNPRALANIVAAVAENLGVSQEADVIAFLAPYRVAAPLTSTKSRRAENQSAPFARNVHVTPRTDVTGGCD